MKLLIDMKKIRPFIYNGTEYLPLAALPFDQFLHFRDWLSLTDILVIEENDGYAFECVQYGVYDFWFDMAREEIQYADMAIF